MKKLADNSIMPFGMHKGKQLCNVPASYLLWLLDQQWARSDWPLLIEYIRDNKSVLEYEVENG